ncbi:MAG TPA: nickel ABC transporter, nickel/metallophore periplasmic binding protein [Syntrophomonadaceae bacterium]|nr:nickel ABC transporter, nickel/metallophore periplasmic binding protein [Syntrophomonadaceae bacterium]
MFQRYKFLISFLILMLLVAVLNGCAKKTSVSVKEKGGEITVAVAEDPGFDQLDAASYNGLIQAYPMIYDSLVEYGEKGKILPALATSWEISPDGKTYTFHLRQGVKFSDGTPFNADAVKFSLERWRQKPEHSSITVSKALEKIEVVDSHTIKLHFNICYYPILTELTYPRPVRVMSPSAVTPAGDPNGKFVKPIGTGPWMVESYTKDQQAVLVRNPNYWGDKPKLSKIVLKVIPDPQARTLALQSGEVDLAGGRMSSIPLESLPLITKDSKLQLHRTEGTTSYFLIFNYNKEFFQDVRIRQAINYAINKKSMVDNLLGGVGKPAQGLFQFTVPYVTVRNNQGYTYNVNKARELLAEAGWKDTDGDGILDKNGKPFKVSLTFQNVEYPEWKPMCEAIQGDLAKVGIQVNLKMLERTAYYDELWKNRGYELIIYRTYSDSWNPHGFLAGLFHAAKGKPAVAWSDPKLELLIDNVLSTMDETERQKIYDEIFHLIYEQAMCVPLYYPEEIIVVNSRVQGFKFGTTSYCPVKWEKLFVTK